MARTKKEIIGEIETKAKSANPLVKRVFLKGLMHNTKVQLEKKLKRMCVTPEGDINLV